MFDITPQQVALLLTIALIIFGARHLSRLLHGDELSQLLAELKRHLPVFSAETMRGKEAEFIRDSLPKRFPFAVVLIGISIVVVAILIWLIYSETPS
jgi:Sec-independent protein translocase protein TatA